MFKQYTKEEVWQLCRKLPENLKEVYFSQATGDYIYDACKKYGAPNEKISLVAGYVGYVLLGILPPNEFQKSLEKEVGLEKNIAESVSSEINFRIFSQVRESLTTATKKEPSETREPDKTETEQEPKKPAGPDTYREPIE